MEFDETESGFLWSNCASLSRDIENKIQKENPSSKIIFREWYDFRQEQFVSQPICKTEFGWILGAVWWPSATKVRMRGKIISNNDYNARLKLKDNGPKGSTPGPAKLGELRRLNEDLNLEKSLEKEATIDSSHQSPSNPMKNEKPSVPELVKPLSLVGFDLGLRSDKYSRNFAELTLKVKNNGRSTVTAFEIVVTISSKLGRKIGRFTLTNESVSIESLETAEVTYSWKDNPFIAGEVYDSLSAVSTENLIVKLESQRVVKKKLTE